MSSLKTAGIDARPAAHFQSVNSTAFAPQRWWRIMPILFISFSLAFLDRANYGFAAAGGIASDLDLTPAASSLIGSMFFLGYFLFQVPGGIYAERHSIKKFMFWGLILWGSFATVTGLVSSVPVLIAVRFLLGVVEGAMMPSMLVYASRWFTRSERSRANTLIMLGNPATVLWMSVLSGYLVHSFGWRGMFIIEGAPAILWAFVWWFTIKDVPADAHWMSDAERAELESRLQSEQTDIAPMNDYSMLFRSKVMIMCCFGYALWSMGVYGFLIWLPSILKFASQADIVSVGWLSAAPYLAAIVTMSVASWLSDRTRFRKELVWPLLLIGMIAFVGSYLVGASNVWVSFALLVIAGGAMFAPFGPWYAFLSDTLPANVLGGAYGLINSSGALGAFLGSFVVGYLNGVTGSPSASYMFMAGALMVSVILIMLVPSRSPVSLPPKGRRRDMPVG